MNSKNFVAVHDDTFTTCIIYSKRQSLHHSGDTRDETALIPFLLLTAFLLLETAFTFNISAFERDPVLEAAAKAVHFTWIEILEQIHDQEYLEYK